MKKLIPLFILFTVGLKAQKNNHLILINQTDSIGIVSYEKGVVFYKDIDKEIKKDIALRFNSKGIFYNRRNIKPSKLHFSNEYYSYNIENKRLVKMIFDENIKTANDVHILELRVQRAGNRYLISESIALGGSVASLALLENEPTIALQITILSQTAAYLVRIAGHITLRSPNRN